uniref:Uncharacterized protein n=1 Tax=Cannabis sativa TaxID=3483 RepID=A0A803Q282_CANSA
MYFVLGPQPNEEAFVRTITRALHSLRNQSSAILARLESVEREHNSSKQGQAAILKGDDYKPDNAADALHIPENITPIGDTQDPKVQVLDIAPPWVEKRPKKRPRWFDEYTKMKKKAKPSIVNLNVDPLRLVDKKLLLSL